MTIPLLVVIIPLTPFHTLFKVLGGGTNGVNTAHALVKRGLNVALIEQFRIFQHTLSRKNLDFQKIIKRQ